MVTSELKDELGSAPHPCFLWLSRHRCSKWEFWIDFRGISGGLLYCIQWLLVTSCCQKGENSHACIFEAQILALEHLIDQGEHQLSVSCMGLMTHNWTIATASRKAAMGSVRVTNLLCPQWKRLRGGISFLAPWEVFVSDACKAFLLYQC